MSVNEQPSVNLIDYIIFFFMISLSTLISLYFGYFKNKNKSVEEYMFGGRNLPTIPVLLSVIASTLSSISLIAVPRETYYYGSVLVYLVFGEFTTSILLYFFYIPVFYHHKFASIFEYVEKRFNKSVRRFGSTVYAINQIFYSLITMYASCSAVSLVTHIPHNVFAPAVCALCTVYSVIGGLRGVIWSDVVQAIFMFTSISTLIITGMKKLPQDESIVGILGNGGRLNLFEFDPSLYPRYTILSTYVSAVGLGLFNTCTNQGCMQRYLSLSTFKKAKNVILSAAFSTAFFLSLPICLGLIIYITYHNCDPFLSKSLLDSNHFVVFYATKTGRALPGLTGFVLAGLLSASMSSMSTMINSISCNVYEDILKPALPWKPNSSQNNYFIKSIAIFFGLIVTFGTLFLDASGGIYQVFRTMTSITGTLIVFMFGFGLFFRKANTKGVVMGSIAGLGVTLWLAIGIQTAVSNGDIKYPTKIVTNEGCHDYNLTQQLSYNLTTVGYRDRVPVVFNKDLPFPYKISFNYISLIGITLSALVGTLVSLLTSDGEEVDESLLIPQLRKEKKNLDKEYFLENGKNGKSHELQLLRNPR